MGWMRWTMGELRLPHVRICVMPGDILSRRRVWVWMVLGAVILGPRICFTSMRVAVESLVIVWAAMVCGRGGVTLGHMRLACDLLWRPMVSLVRMCVRVMLRVLGVRHGLVRCVMQWWVGHLGLCDMAV